MTGFSTAEEQQEENAGHLDGHMPFYVDQELGRLGGEVTVATPWSSNAIRDRELITGQNPMSEEAFTALYLEALVESRFARMLPKTISTTATIMPNQLYQMGSMSFDPHVWKHPYTTLWIGQRSDSSNDFWQHLKRHIELTSATFADKGLDGYIFYGSDDYEIALMHWTSKEAATAAFASKSGQNVVKDAGSFLTPVLFQETAITPRAQ